MNNLKVKLSTSSLDRGLGLIGKKKPEAVMFLTRFGIHTFGLRFPIDVLVLSEKDTVVKLSEKLKPNRFFFWPIKYKKVIELPSGHIKSQKVKIGSKIKLLMIK